MADSADHLLLLFMSEAEEKLAEMEAGWEALNAGAEDADSRATLCRGAEGLTGGAAMLGLWGLAEFGGAVERMSNQMPDAEKADPVILHRLREYIDELRRQVQRVRSQL